MVTCLNLVAIIKHNTDRLEVMVDFTIKFKISIEKLNFILLNTTSLMGGSWF